MLGKTALLATVALWIGVPSLAGAVEPEAFDPGHLIEIRMVDNGGGQWRFQPSTVQAHPGDTVRFIQTDIVPHNVQFKSEPAGAQLGTAQMGPFLLKKGDTYDLVIDGRFAPGTYNFVCTPHEMLGMKGTLQVVADMQSDDGIRRSPSPFLGGDS